MFHCSKHECNVETDVHAENHNYSDNCRINFIYRIPSTESQSVNIIPGGSPQRTFLNTGETLLASFGNKTAVEVRLSTDDDINDHCFFSNFRFYGIPYTNNPTIDPTIEPTSPPSHTTGFPTLTPTVEPTIDPTKDPTTDPTAEPTSDPTADPTHLPTYLPTMYPTTEPTYDPSEMPTAYPSNDPTVKPSVEPTAEPTDLPSYSPSNDPTMDPTAKPSTKNIYIGPQTSPTVAGEGQASATSSPSTLTTITDRSELDRNNGSGSIVSDDMFIIIVSILSGTIVIGCIAFCIFYHTKHWKNSSTSSKTLKKGEREVEIQVKTMIESGHGKNTESNTQQILTKQLSQPAVSKEGNNINTVESQGNEDVEELFENNGDTITTPGNGTKDIEIIYKDTIDTAGKRDITTQSEGNGVSNENCDNEDLYEEHHTAQ